MKAMSIIGIIWFTFSLLVIFSSLESDLEVAAGWGLLGLLYALPYSIVGLVEYNKKQKKNLNSAQILANLRILKEKGIFTEDEFQVKIIELWKRL